MTNSASKYLVYFMTDILSTLCIGYSPKGHPVMLASPVDQLLPISESLVKNVEKTLRKIVQMAIECSLSKFPTLKQAVEAKVVNKIFDTKREQTTQFIRQFLEMQKKSIDQVFAPVPTPHEINLWESYPLKDGKFHPCMTSKTMSHMKGLARKLYSDQMVQEIEGHGHSSTQASFLNYKVSLQHGCILHAYLLAILISVIEPFEHLLELWHSVEKVARNC